jgi:hypothetical protein
MTPANHLSPIQFLQQPDGSMSLKGLPNITIDPVEGQGTELGRNWQSELGCPIYYEEWEELARVEGLSDHRVAFILMDEAPMRRPGAPRLCPPQVTLPQAVPFELGHSGFVVGVCFAWVRSEGEDRTAMSDLLGMDMPNELEGEYIVGVAQLFKSELAERAWVGLEQNIFTHVCPNILQPTGASPGTGSLVQVTLTPGDYPGCPHARILRLIET